jgi:REP element-mobilizing transposase RayT
MWYGSRAIDEYSGTRYEHRWARVEDKVLWLSSVFSIGICAYAVMSNHVHLVLCVDKDKAMSWSDKQVVGRWHRLYRGILLSQKFMRNALLSENEWISFKEDETYLEISV